MKIFFTSQASLTTRKCTCNVHYAYAEDRSTISINFDRFQNKIKNLLIQKQDNDQFIFIPFSDITVDFRFHYSKTLFPAISSYSSYLNLPLLLLL